MRIQHREQYMFKVLAPACESVSTLFKGAGHLGHVETIIIRSARVRYPTDALLQ